MRDQFVHAFQVIGHAIGVVSRDVRNRSRGTWARIRTLPGGWPARRSRTRSWWSGSAPRMGRYVPRPRPIEVTARQGRVTLSGPVFAHEVEGLMSAVASVSGVVDVEDRLEVRGEPGDTPGRQDGRARVGESAELWQVNWSPTARLMVGSATFGLTPRLRGEPTGNGRACTSAPLARAARPRRHQYPLPGLARRGRLRHTRRTSAGPNGRRSSAAWSGRTKQATVPVWAQEP